MNEIKHTPGPLVVDSNTQELPVRVYSKTTQGNVGYFFNAGDATLFAAAPDLLDVLTRMVEQITDPANAEHTLNAFSYGARIAEARAAIAKATGGAA